MSVVKGITAHCIDCYVNHDYVLVPHRDDGPAITSTYYKYDGTKYITLPVQSWYQYGKLHREDGPALIIGDEEEYWENGVDVTWVPI